MNIGTRILGRFEDTVYDESSNETTNSSTSDKENSYQNKRGANKTYKFFDEYETVEKAQTVLKNEGWKYECKKVIKFETKICYRCGEEKSRYVK
jgi:hypothetical protein